MPTKNGAGIAPTRSTDRTILLREGTPAFLTELTPTTQSYFRRLPGYDTRIDQRRNHWILDYRSGTARFVPIR